MTTKTKVLPILYSVPMVETLNLPKRAEMLPQIESGEIDHIDFRARVYGTGRNRNPVQFLDGDMERFALSFEGKPFLRDHEQCEIEAREGTILSSALMNGEIVQDIRITTRRGMTDYIEGRIDRFSIGWDSDAAICSICNSEYIGGTCSHIAGRMYQTQMGEQMCVVIFINPVGIETSAVNVPAVDGTRVESQLQRLKLMLNTDDGQAPDVSDKPNPDEWLAQARTRYLGITTRALHLLSGDTMNLREKIQTRSGKLSRASELTELADTEKRDFTEAENVEFNTLMADVDSLTAEISSQTEQREKLRTELAREFSVPAASAEKPENTNKTANTLKRAEFEALSASGRAQFLKSGGTIA